MKQHYVMPVGVDDFRRVREEYYSEFEQRGGKEVWQYGIAFCGKKCQIEAAAGII